MTHFHTISHWLQKDEWFWRYFLDNATQTDTVVPVYPPPPPPTHTHIVTGGIRMVEGKVRTTAMKNVPQYGNMMVLWREHGHGKYPTVTSKSTISMGTERQQGSLLLLVCKISHFGQQVDNWHRNTCSLREQSGLVRKISHCDQQVNY